MQEAASPPRCPSSPSCARARASPRRSLASCSLGCVTHPSVTGQGPTPGAPPTAPPRPSLASIHPPTDSLSGTPQPIRAPHRTTVRPDARSVPSASAAEEEEDPTALPEAHPRPPADPSRPRARRGDKATGAPRRRAPAPRRRRGPTPRRGPAPPTSPPTSEGRRTGRAHTPPGRAR